MNGPQIHVGQMGYLCDAPKRVVLPATGIKAFEIQDMTLVASEALGPRENWQAVYRGELQPHRGPMGDFLVGDFSGLNRPGFYRAVLPGVTAYSYPFVVADGVFSRLPGMFLDCLHQKRCGDFEDELRAPCHLDDGVRSDNGAAVDAVGGWHDAGDVRKWMGTTTQPILGFFQMRDRQAFARTHWRERYGDDVFDEIAWGLRFILKMQDPATGMIYEDVAGGGESRRKPGMEWWYENHFGNYADNSGNYYSDNRRGSGDERIVRVQYNPIVQYINASILLDAGRHFKKKDAALAESCHQAALRCWEFMSGRINDPFHAWTSVQSWRLLTGLRLFAVDLLSAEDIAALAQSLLALQSQERGWWFMDGKRDDLHRGILNAAQPVIALTEFILACPAHPLAGAAHDALERCWERHVLPMRQTNPFGIMPYGIYFKPATDGDVYHELGNGLFFRFFMPQHCPRGAGHGLSSHWTSWAHGLALMGQVLKRRECAGAAMDQLHWVTGCNPLNASLISGVGYNNVMPYSRFAGRLDGGFCLGPRGDDQDRMVADMEGYNDWSTGEYWTVPTANTLMALSVLMPQSIEKRGKLGGSIARQ